MTATPFVLPSQWCQGMEIPVATKTPRVTDVLEIMDGAENCHVGIRTSSPKKMLASTLQLQSICTNAHVGNSQQELEAFVVILE